MRLIQSINQVGARAQERRDYASANATIERTNLVTDLSNKVVALRKEWELFVAAPRSRQEKQISRAKRRNLGRIETGLCTPQTDYYHPILQALQDLGGSVRTNDVLKKVELFMKGTLREVDYEPLPSKPFMLRWEETAQWARYKMVEVGLLQRDSPWGIWEITEAGRMAFTKVDY